MSRRIVDGKLPKPRPNANKGGRVKGSFGKLTEDQNLIDNINKMLRIGSHVEIAAAANGIGYSTLRLWIIKGKEDPKSLYGAFHRAFLKSMAESEIRDLANIDNMSVGRPAEYLMEPVMEPVFDEKGNLVKVGKDPMMRPAKDGNGKPIMKPKTDGEGNLIKVRSEIKPAWQASAWKLERRHWQRWGRVDRINDDVMKAEKDNKPREREVISAEEKERKLIEYRQVAENLSALDDDEYSK